MTITGSITPTDAIDFDAEWKRLNAEHQQNVDNQWNQLNTEHHRNVVDASGSAVGNVIDKTIQSFPVIGEAAQIAKSWMPGYTALIHHAMNSLALDLPEKFSPDFKQQLATDAQNNPMSSMAGKIAGTAGSFVGAEAAVPVKLIGNAVGNAALRQLAIGSGIQTVKSTADVATNHASVSEALGTIALDGVLAAIGGTIGAGLEAGAGKIGGIMTEAPESVAPLATKAIGSLGPKHLGGSALMAAMMGHPVAAGTGLVGSLLAKKVGQGVGDVLSSDGGLAAIRTLGASLESIGKLNLLAPLGQTAAAGITAELRPERAADIGQVVSNATPENLQAAIKLALPHASPDEHNQASSTISAALDTLKAALPKTTNINPLSGVNVQPSSDQLAGFDKTLHSLLDPVGVIMRGVASGVLTGDVVRAVQSAYPMLFQRIQQQVLDGIGNLGNDALSKVPAARKAAISLILGLSDPYDTAALQQNFATDQTGQQPAPKWSPLPSAASQATSLQTRLHA